MNDAWTAYVSTPEDMKRLGAALGRALCAGDVLALVGPLGAGKTTFAQGLAQGLDVPADRHVASPSFALVNEHPGRVPFVHADLYRIERAEELRELGLEEAYDRAATAVEWADRFAGVLPGDHVAVTFAFAEAGARQITFCPAGPRSRELVERLAAGHHARPP